MHSQIEKDEIILPQKTFKIVSLRTASEEKQIFLKTYLLIFFFKNSFLAC